MKKVTQFFSVVGILSGLLFIAGGLWYGRLMGFVFVVAPLIVGVIIVAVHASGLVRLRGGFWRAPRWLLVVANLALLGLFVLGQMHIVQTRLHGPLFLWAFGSLFLLPFAVNIVYWAGFDRVPSPN